MKEAGSAHSSVRPYLPIGTGLVQLSSSQTPAWPYKAVLYKYCFYYHDLFLQQFTKWSVEWAAPDTASKFAKYSN